MVLVFTNFSKRGPWTKRRLTASWESSLVSHTKGVYMGPQDTRKNDTTLAPEIPMLFQSHCRGVIWFPWCLGVSVNKKVTEVNTLKWLSLTLMHTLTEMVWSPLLLRVLKRVSVWIPPTSTYMSSTEPSPPMNLTFNQCDRILWMKENNTWRKV